jgi:hypothetical protein
MKEKNLLKYTECSSGLDNDLSHVSTQINCIHTYIYTHGLDNDLYKYTNIYIYITYLKFICMCTGMDIYILVCMCMFIFTNT